MIRLDSTGQRQRDGHLPGTNPTALTVDRSGEIVAAGTTWSTFGEQTLPDWFGTPVAVFAE